MLVLGRFLNVWCMFLPVMVGGIPAPPTTTPKHQREHGYFPNPQTDLAECGQSARPSWVCDPTRELLQATLDEADVLIASIRNQSICPCPQSSCQDQYTGGYKVGVAVVESLSHETYSEPELIGKAVSDNIRNHQWKMGACDEDIVIVVCVADGRIYMSVGQTAQQAFVYQCELETGQKFRRLVRQTDIGNFDRGLLLALRDIKSTVLEHRQCGSHFTVIRWWHMAILGGGVLLVVIIVIGGVMMSHRRRAGT